MARWRCLAWTASCGSSLKGPDRPNNVDVEYGLDARRDAHRHRGADRAARTPVARLRYGARRRLRCATSRPARCRFSQARQATRARRWASACIAGRKTARFSRSSRRKSGPKENYLWQYRLDDDGTGRVKATLVRRFGMFSGVGEIEAIAVDDELGTCDYADEVAGIHKWPADPDAPGARIASSRCSARADIGRTARASASIRCPEGKGYIVSVDQLPGESIFHVYPREGEPGRPHDHSTELLTFTGGADGPTVST